MTLTLAPLMLLAAMTVASPPAAVHNLAGTCTDDATGGPGPVATFSIVAADPRTRMVGVAVASRFFAVGSVVPWARADAGAMATQAFANTSFGPYGLILLEQGGGAEGILKQLLSGDDQPERRQVGIVTASGDAAAHTGEACTAWAGHRVGRGYAIQGNILAGEDVVAAMERAFLDTPGSLAQRLYAALDAGDEAGGDARGRQSAALMVARRAGGYGGFTDRYIDIRVDDHADPVAELERLLEIAEVNGLWNLAWTAYTQERLEEALPLMERTAGAALAAQSDVLPEVLYDLAVVRAASGHLDAAMDALRDAIAGNPGLAAGARDDSDLAPLRHLPAFRLLTSPPAESSEDDLLCPADKGGEESEGDASAARRQEPENGAAVAFQGRS
jgi:uncharacterized Ntn-hydrolase superfamily protein